MRRKLYIVLGIILASVIGYITYLFKGTKSDINAYSYIPESAIFVIESKAPVKGWKEFSKSKTWQHIKALEAFKDIEAIADNLDQTIKDNKSTFKLIGKRKLLLSAHMTKKDDYDFLYVLDVQTKQKSLLEGSLINLFKSGNYRHKKSPYKQTIIHDFYSSSDKSTLHFVLMGDYLVLSYSKAILITSIENYTTIPAFTSQDGFTQLENEIDNDELCRVFVNYKNVPDYLHCYMDVLSPELKSFLNSLEYSGFEGEIKKEEYILKGKTTLSKREDSYSMALQKSGASKMGAQEVLSDKTAFLLKLGFNDIESFYNNLVQVLKDNNEYSDFEKNKRKVEKYLSINVEEDFLSWMDDEIVIAQYEKRYLVNDKLQNIVAIKANDINLAKDKLKNIEKQIRKKTPIKFKSAKYKEHEIHYMEIKGLFEIVFGELFSKINKPYYTFIDDYVLFSDDVKSLLFTIEAYENNTTLEENDEFMEFKESFESKSTVFAYLSAPLYFDNFYKILESESWNSLKTNKEYVTCFKHIGIVLSSEEEGFNTELSSAFELPDKETDDQLEEKEETISNMELFVITHLNKNKRKLFYESGELKVIVPIRNNVYNGYYYEFHKNGEVKVKGKYKNGKKTGRFRFFNERGKKTNVEKH